MDTPDDDLQRLLAGLDPESQLLISQYNLGKEVEELLGRDIGRTLVGMAQQEYILALLELEKVGWWRRRKIQELQNKAWKARTFCVWLRELVLQGKQSLGLIHDRES